MQKQHIKQTCQVLWGPFLNHLAEKHLWKKKPWYETTLQKKNAKSLEVRAWIIFLKTNFFKKKTLKYKKKLYKLPSPARARCLHHLSEKYTNIGIFFCQLCFCKTLYASSPWKIYTNISISIYIYIFYIPHLETKVFFGGKKRP